MSLQLYAKRVNLIKKFEAEINIVLNVVKSSYNLSASVKDIETALMYLHKLYSAVQGIAAIENSALMLHLLQVINTKLTTITSNTTQIIDITHYTSITNAEYYKTYKAQYQQLYNNCTTLDIELYACVTSELYTQNFTNCNEQQIVDNFTELCSVFKSYAYTFTLYTQLTKQLLAEHYANITICAAINVINEQMKNYVLMQATDNLQSNKVPLADYAVFTTNNPYLKTFGLVPVSNVMSLQDVTRILFPDTQYTLQQACIKKNYDLIIIQKYLNRGINYSIIDWLDYTKSKEFTIQNSADDGITCKTINRFNSIQYLAPINKSINFKISYDYVQQNNTNKFIYIIEEIYPGQYHILSNVISTYITYVIRKSTLTEFIEFVTTTSAPRSRIENYNTIINRSLALHMFSGQQKNVKQLEEKSAAYDPANLRFNIYTAITAKYEQNTKVIKNIYAFSKLLHNEEFITIFENIITDEYNKLIKNKKYTHSILFELYTSFIYDLSVYVRDFKKNLHDAFVSKVIEITSTPFDNKTLTQVFNTLVKNVLNSVISNEKNVFQSLNYKLYLLNAN